MPRPDLAATPAAPGARQPSVLWTRLTVVVLTAAVAVAGVVALADAAGEHDGPSRWDPATATEVLKARTPALTHLAQTFTFLGSEVVLGGIAILLCLTLLVLRRITQAVTFAVGIGGSAVLTVAVKLLVARPRPGSVDRLGIPDTSYSFPSGHTLNTAVLVTLVVWLLWSSVGYAGRVALVVVAAILILGVAASRVYLGYHWLTDVLASGLVAIAWLCVVWLVGSAAARIAPPTLGERQSWRVTRSAA